MSDILSQFYFISKQLISSINAEEAVTTPQIKYYIARNMNACIRRFLVGIVGFWKKKQQGKQTGLNRRGVILKPTTSTLPTTLKMPEKA